MRYFGEPWSSPALEGVAQAPTPVGSACLDCKEPIGEGERGVLIPHGDQYGGVSEQPHHAECFLREMLGPLRVVRQMFRDPPPVSTPMSPRQEAQEVWRLVMERAA